MKYLKRNTPYHCMDILRSKRHRLDKNGKGDARKCNCIIEEHLQSS